MSFDNSHPLRWIVRLGILLLFAEASYRALMYFQESSSNSFSSPILIGLAVFLAGILLIGEWVGTIKGQHRFSLQLVIFYGFLAAIGLFAILNGAFTMRDLAIGNLRLPICIGVWAYFRQALLAVSAELEEKAPPT